MHRWKASCLIARREGKRATVIKGEYVLAIKLLKYVDR
jgi:hypothetical protein